MALNWVANQAHHLCIAYSADGLRWKPGPKRPRFCEMGGITKFKDLHYLTAQAGMPRRLDVFSSPDFEHWTYLGAGFARDHLPPLEEEKESHLPDADKWAPGGIGKGEQVHCGAGLWNRGNVVLGVYVNASGLDKQNQLHVSLLDERGEPVPGFSGTDGAVLATDGLRIPVLWKGNKLSSRLGTVRIQVDFRGTKPRLHALYVGDGEPQLMKTKRKQ